MNPLTAYLWIGVGSALGGMGRYFVSGILAKRFGEVFPIGTLAVNVGGSFLIGLVAALGAPEGRMLLPPPVRQFVMLGVLGSYTTFSSFSLQTLKLVQDGEWLHAAVNVALSVLLCLVGVWLGHLVGDVLNH